MSTGDDGGYGSGGEYGGHGSGQTRTRLPDGDSGMYGSGRRSRTGISSRNLVTIVGVMVLLIAAIAFANRGGGGGSNGASAGDKASGAQPTAPTGEKPVTKKNGSVPSDFPRSEQGAQSAAANYAVALGSDGMFKKASRHDIVQAIADSRTTDKLQAGFDADYSPALFAQIGLKEDGSAPSGMTFVNRTVPAGAKVTKYEGNTADVSVWCVGLFGLAGPSSTKPVTSNWFTVTFDLKWNGSDWKVVGTGQKKGPTPVNGDNPVSGSDEITDAVNGFGGFTYAR